VHAVLQRQLKERPPMTDVFGVKGRAWLARQREQLPLDEQQTVDACLRQIDFLEAELELVDREIAKQVLACQDIRRLMTLPGVSGVTATALLAAVGDIRRFPTADHLVGYLGLSPRVHQSGSEPAKHGRISKQAPDRCVGYWSRQPGMPQGQPGRCARFTNAWPPNAGSTSRPSPSRASSS
jgi:transposase